MPEDVFAPGPVAGVANPVAIPVLERRSTWTRKAWWSPQIAQSPLAELWNTRAYRLFVVCTIYLTGVCIAIPYISTLEADFFATEKAGKPMTCTDLPEGQKPPQACVEAHSAVTTWNSWRSFFTYAVLAVYFNPAFGTWSDLYGRRPFIAVGIFLDLIPRTALLLYIVKGLPLYWYYPCSVIKECVSTYTVSLGYLGDVISAQNRSVVFGFYTTTFFLSSTLGSLASLFKIIRDPFTALVCGLATTSLSIILIFTWLPESLPENTRLLAREKAVEFGAAGGQGFFAGLRRAVMSAAQSLRILLRTKLFLKLTLTMMLVMIVFQDSIDFLFQYLQEVAGFRTIDQAASFSIIGIGGLITCSLLLWIAFTLLGMSETWVLIIGILAYSLEEITLAFTKKKWVAFAAIGVSTLGDVVLPAIQSIKSKSVGPEEQGAVQGALVGARSFAQGIGPFIFLAFFRAFRSGSLYFPGAPFVASAVLELLALCIVLTIRLPPGVAQNSLLKGEKASKQPYSLADVEEAEPLL